jgi:hypothetical protein
MLVYKMELFFIIIMHDIYHRCAYYRYFFDLIGVKRVQEETPVDLMWLYHAALGVVLY